MQVEVALPAGVATPADRAQALEQVRRAALGCRDCPLGEIGTQTVFGLGPATARLMFVGEAPGYQEDQQGVPFVGPSGQLLDEGMAQAGIDYERAIELILEDALLRAGKSVAARNLAALAKT